ncbi:uncharacterized protein JCM6883_006325 [Sporobolomyces salmoneus]|uniref:uncharacterized protein n=1 Tax=Sporobolomyces salmoneus TaxID=183962 RepID=UPI003172EDCC
MSVLNGVQLLLELIQMQHWAVVQIQAVVNDPRRTETGKSFARDEYDERSIVFVLLFYSINTLLTIPGGWPSLKFDESARDGAYEVYRESFKWFHETFVPDVAMKEYEGSVEAPIVDLAAERVYDDHRSNDRKIAELAEQIQKALISISRELESIVQFSTPSARHHVFPGTSHQHVAGPQFHAVERGRTPPGTPSRSSTSKGEQSPQH